MSPRLRPALLCGPLFLSILNYRTANCPRIAAPYCASVECPAALFYISAQPKPSIFGWLFITHLLLVINGELGQFALYHQHIMWLPCFCFPAVPHFNNRYLRVTYSTSRTSTATSTAPSTQRPQARGGLYEYRTAPIIYPIMSKHQAPVIYTTGAPGDRRLRRFGLVAGAPSGRCGHARAAQYTTLCRS